MTLVFEHATLIDGLGRDPQPRMRVTVEGHRIQRIARDDSGPLPRDAQVIDCQGRTLMPGLLDAHVHLAIVELDELAAAALPPAVLAARITREIAATLDAGFTTVRDAGGLDFGFKEAIRLGLIRGPRIFVSGPFISQTGGHGDARPRGWRGPMPSIPGISPESILADGAEQVRWAAREALRRGADQIKLHASGGAASETDELTHTQFSIEELAAAVDVARSVDTYVLTHAYAPRAIQNSVKAGVRSIEHANLLDEETADAMLAANDVYMVPTIITYELLAREEVGPGWSAVNSRKIKQGLEGAYNALGLAYEKGLRIASGSDVLAHMQPHKGREIACQARVMGAMGAITAATRVNAQLMRIEDEVGTVEAGKQADLIVVDGDPLQHPEVLGDPGHVRVVALAGEVVKNLDAGRALAPAGAPR
ncbi:MAG TPA: amidohydrolase family protein [Candidatus Limnocylindrales bacterium]|nr:amidohydrolase family protein [Candidatus Limnocylindrales bacterium]